MNYQETIKYIEKTEWKGSRLGNERMVKLMDLLGNPQDDLHFIHVAGTNGKGSCVASLSSILSEAGYKVGMYTSPHLIKYEERFMINGKCISPKDLAKVTEIVKEASEKLKDQPTVFEKLTAIGFVYFKLKKCDLVVLEVGMGGRLDATNVIKNPELCIIMNIGLEHTEVLGDTLAKIAFEKAGIIKEGSDVVAYHNSKEVLDVFKNVAKERNAKLKIAKFKEIKIHKEGFKGQVFDYGDLKNIKLSLLGKHQFYNAATIIEACYALKNKGYKISIKNIRDGLKKTTWDARLSLLCDEPMFILDGAHNPQCAEALSDSLPKLLGKKKAIILCGMLADKDYNSVMDMMIPFAKEFVCLTPVSNRALPAKDLAEVLKNKKQIAVAAVTIDEGIKMALDKAGKKGIVIAFGSLYLAGYIAERFSAVYKKWSRSN